MISKELAVEIAVSHAIEIKLTQFTVAAAWLVDDEYDGKNWYVQLEFVNVPDDGFIYLDTSVIVHVDGSSGRPWMIQSL